MDADQFTVSFMSFMTALLSALAPSWCDASRRARVYRAARAAAVPFLLASASATLFIVHARLARTRNQEQLGAEIFQGAPGKVLLRMIGTRFSSDP
jgi:sirohydrochlorin ferrochelatase